MLEKVLTLGCGKTTLDSSCVHISSYTNFDASGVYIRSIDGCFSRLQGARNMCYPTWPGLSELLSCFLQSCSPCSCSLVPQSLPDFASSPPSLRTGSVCGFSGASRGDLSDLRLKPRTVSSVYYVFK